MRILRYPLFLLMTLCLTGCGGFFFERDRLPPDLAFSDAASEAVIKFGYTLRRERGLFLEDAQVFGDDESGIERIMLVFSSQDIMEICDARELVVDIVEGALQAIDKNVEDELAVHPFPVENLRIYIEFESFYSRFADPTYMGWIDVEDGIVSFYAFDTKDEKRNRWLQRKEHYFQSYAYVTHERAAAKEYEEAHPVAESKLGNERYHALRSVEI